jgi:hypothetical protein
MMPTRVALFPYEDQLARDGAFVDELMLVASALQTQVMRDVGPIWGVSAVVSAFSSLNRVPEGYNPIGITQQNLPLNREAFHFTAGGRPAALIQHCGDWSTAASHELIEMLCDPTGTKTITAPSVADLKLFSLENRSNVIEDANDYADQGLVAYVMEVCDPVEQSTYQIGTVNVSDFVTPDFYVPETGQPYTRYSFTGDVKEPLQLLPGGYITWATQGPSSQLFQAFALLAGNAPVGPGDLEIKALGPTPNVLSRAWLDAKAGDDDDRTSRATAACGAAVEYVDRSDNAKEFAEGIRRQMDRAREASGSPADLDTLLTVVRKLARDDAFRDLFKESPTKALESIGLDPAGAPSGPIDLQPRKIYQKFQGSLEQGHRVGYNFNEDPFDPSLQYLSKFPGI